MHQFTNILFVSHGISDETAVLKETIKLAIDNEARLSVLIVCPDFPKRLKDYVQPYEQTLKDHLNENIKAAISELNLNKKKPDIAIHVESGKTPDIRIIRHVLRHSHDLLVKEIESSDNAKGFKALDMELLRKCLCALFLHRPSKHAYNKLHVAVAIDPFEEDQAGLDLTIELLQISHSLAKQYTGKLSIFSCWSFALEGYVRGNPWLKITPEEIDNLLAEEKESHKKAIKEQIKAAKIKDNYTIVQLKGQPEYLIPKEIEHKKIDILVMGTVARTGISGFIIGNTAENILQRINCSLLALKPQGFTSPVKAYE
ncbi:universal stress protein [Legionella israelensis]|uniref:Universal stress protein n=1 Tax=Legionella israelensis TaxID=454 RepID=A0AAX1EIL8_9GAMM|nr:universal stress protein [Legionella israelensis]QBR84874.1 universal stress protein [Legionella israelensis]